MATLKGAIVEKVRYDFEDSQARETAEEALKQAETVANEITGVETTLVEVQKNIQTIAENANTATEKATEAQVTAEEAKAIAEEAQKQVTGEPQTFELFEEEAKLLTQAETEKLIGKPLSEVKSGDKWVLFYGDGSNSYPTTTRLILLEANENTFKTSDAIKEVTSLIFEAHFQVAIQNESSSNAHQYVLWAFPLQ